jgi:PhoPQ-activated pathogenicity-related protein
MVKSAVRAMDTVQKHLGSLDSGAINVTEFVVSGGSKRGWTTWLTAAVDKRVVAIAPAVIDVLNMDEQMKHHFSAYGFYSNAIADYVEMNVFERLDTPRGRELTKFIDPYEYRDRYANIPKCLINSTGDQFFLPDSAQFYFHDLPGEKHIRYVPNTDHGLGSSDAIESLLVFFKSVVVGASRPKFTWSVNDDCSIEVKTTTKPTAVKLWQATNPNTRNFRLDLIGPVWKSSALSEQGGGAYIAKVPKPEKGWTAFFAELTFDSGGPIPYKFTTQVSVIPKTLPFAK